MKRFYAISKAQLITIWIFGGIAVFWSIEKASYSHYTAEFTLPEFVSWFLPLALFFYTIGWREHTKKK